ncbi:hypothetical protein Bpro_1937 [Polaromonas sp. JS666]|nr:hypothetical protein Bpro_1937 [Polaromonas sp. JS666]
MIPGLNRDSSTAGVQPSFNIYRLAYVTGTMAPEAPNANLMLALEGQIGEVRFNAIFWQKRRKRSAFVRKFRGGCVFQPIVDGVSG